MRPTGTVGTFVGENEHRDWGQRWPIHSSYQLAGGSLCAGALGRSGGEGVPVVLVTVQKEVFSPRLVWSLFCQGKKQIHSSQAMYINVCLICFESLLLTGAIISVWENLRGDVMSL